MASHHCLFGGPGSSDPDKLSGFGVSLSGSGGTESGDAESEMEGSSPQAEAWRLSRRCNVSGAYCSIKRGWNLLLIEQAGHTYIQRAQLLLSLMYLSMISLRSAV